MSRFPVVFRPPAFASRSSDSRRRIGPSSRSAYRTSPPGPRRGLPRFARTSCERGGCLLCPEDGGAHPGWAGFPVGACRFPAASPCTPLPHPIGGADRNETSARGLRASPVRSASRLWPQMGRAPLGFCLMLRTPPGTPATHVRPRPGREHGPGTTPSIFVEPPINVFTQCVRPRVAGPSGLPLACGRPDGTGRPWAHASGFAPRRPRAGRRTPRWGQAIEHRPGTTRSTHTRRSPIR